MKWLSFVGAGLFFGFTTYFSLVAAGDTLELLTLNGFMAEWTESFRTYSRQMWESFFSFFGITLTVVDNTYTFTNLYLLLMIPSFFNMNSNQLSRHYTGIKGNTFLLILIVLLPASVLIMGQFIGTLFPVVIFTVPIFVFLMAVTSSILEMKFLDTFLLMRNLGFAAMYFWGFLASGFVTWASSAT